MTTPDDTAALVAEAREYAAKQTEFAALWLPEHPKTARETQYPADLLTRLAAALEAATAREGRLREAFVMVDVIAHDEARAESARLEAIAETVRDALSVPRHAD